MSFSQTSRYFSTETAIYETADGTQIRYLRRRFLPQLDRFTPIQQHLVTQGDRLDNITALYLGDAELFWRICDANPVEEPEQLETVGRRILITLPEGIPGLPNA